MPPINQPNGWKSILPHYVTQLQIVSLPVTVGTGAGVWLFNFCDTIRNIIHLSLIFNARLIKIC
jgi:hypothetical protein